VDRYLSYRCSPCRRQTAGKMPVEEMYRYDSMEGEEEGIEFCLWIGVFFARTHGAVKLRLSS